MKRDKPVLVVGDLNVDLVMTRFTSAPQPGREVLARGCLFTLGGSAGNVATALGRLGRPVKFAGRVGRDTMGDMLVGMMRKRGVDVSSLDRDRRIGTGIAVALSYTPDRAFVSYLGTVEKTRLRDLRLGALDRCRHLHLTSPFLQAGIRRDFPRLLDRARGAGLTTSFDPGWDPAGKWNVGPILARTDYLLVNEEEAKALTGLERPAAGAVALSHRVPLVVVKTGPEGAIAASEGRVWKAATYPVKPLDTTGAGDSFNAGFLDALLSGQAIDEALAFGCACGALSTCRPGGYEGQATRAQARRLMKGRRR